MALTVLAGDFAQRCPVVEAGPLPCLCQRGLDPIKPANKPHRSDQCPARLQPRSVPLRSAAHMQIFMSLCYWMWEVLCEWRKTTRGVHI